MPVEMATPRVLRRLSAIKLLGAAAVASPKKLPATALPPRGKKSRPLPSLIYGVDVRPEISAGPELTDSDIEFFKTNGYLVKQGLLDKASLAPIVDLVWENAPPFVSRNDPATWIDPPFVGGLHNSLGSTTSKDGRSGSWSERPGPPDGTAGFGIFQEGRHGGQKAQSWKLMSPTPNPDPQSTEPGGGGDLILSGRPATGLGAEPFVLATTANAPNVLRVVERMLGSPVRLAARTRGVYTLWPTTDHETKTTGGHNDGRPGQLSAMVLVEDVPAHSGGFTVWPGSPAQLYHFWETSEGNGMSDVARPSYQQQLDQIIRTTRPVEIAGSAGSVCFWHHRMVHSGGVNRTADRLDGPVVRIVVPCDFQRAGLTLLETATSNPGPNHQWWVHTRQFVEDKYQADMWADWGI